MMTIRMTRVMTILLRIGRKACFVWFALVWVGFGDFLGVGFLVFIGLDFNYVGS